MSLSTIHRCAAALVAVTLLAACGGSQGGAPTQAVYDPGVAPFTEEQAAPYLSIANSKGVEPCGVFDVKGHGQKVATWTNYPACTAASYTVECLNGEAQWTDEFVSDVTVSGGAVHFTSAQDGICALFPKSGS